MKTETLLNKSINNEDDKEGDIIRTERNSKSMNASAKLDNSIQEMS